MDKFVVINSEGKFGIEKQPTTFSVNGHTTLGWTKNLNEATLFSNLSFNNLGRSSVQQVVTKLPAEETRIIKLLGGNYEE